MAGAPALTRRQAAKDWLKELQDRCRLLETMQILRHGQARRIRLVQWDQFAYADRDRMGEAGYGPRSVMGIAIAHNNEGSGTQRPEAGSSMRGNALYFHDSERLTEGALGFQIFINDAQRGALGMNFQLQGRDRQRDRTVYVRYDLDTVQMGTGPVAHFRAHWHHGEDPDSELSEKVDPRLPAPLLDPGDVLDHFIEYFFPKGPDSLTDR